MSPSGVWRRSPLKIAIVLALVGALTLAVRTLDRGGPAPDADVRGRDVASASVTMITAAARGIETSAEIVALSSFTLTDGAELSFHGRIDGVSTPGRIVVKGREVSVEAAEIRLKGPVLVKGHDVRLPADGDRWRLTPTGRTTVSGDSVTFETDGRAVAQPIRLSFQPLVQRDLANEPVGTVIVHRQGNRRDDPGTRWLDPPETLMVSDQTPSLTSWAGQTSVRLRESRFVHEFGALSARSIRASITRDGGNVTVSAEAVARQVYLDGVPQLATRATCDELDVEETMEAGDNVLGFTWAPRNGGDFDMLITRLRPQGKAAGWLSFGLLELPSRFGGEDRDAIGGVTDGFHGGVSIDALIPPGRADRREIGVRVPDGTAPGVYDASVVIEGNFPPVTVPFEVTVE